MKIKLLLTTALIVLTITTTFAQRVNFSGKWKFNVEKSEFGRVPQGVIFDHATIKQTKDSIQMFTAAMDKDGQSSPLSTVGYALDDSPTSRILHDTLNAVGSCKFSVDQKQLLKKLTYSSTKKPEQPLKSIYETWSLSTDGLQLIVERDFVSFNKTEASYKIKAVYDKQ